MTTLNKNASDLKDAIDEYCRARLHQGKCEENDCEFCCMYDAYYMAKEDEYGEDQDEKEEE